MVNLLIMKNKYWSRRDLLKTMGFVALGTSVKPVYTRFEESGEPVILPINKRYKKPGQPITCVVLGAGGRGRSLININGSPGSMHCKYPNLPMP